MARIKHVNCPQCGGTLSMVGMDRVVKCWYCGTWSLVDSADLMPEYWVRPRLRPEEARRKIQTLLRHSDMPRGLLRESRFHSAHLLFIPYYEFTGRRLGTMTLTEWKKTRHTLAFTADGEAESSQKYMSLSEQKARGLAEKTVDTRIVMGDLHRISPAVHLPEWALSEAELDRLRAEPEGTLQPINRKLLERLGKVYHPTLSPDNLHSQLAGPSLAETQDQTEVHEVRIKRIFYPVYRIRYQYQGRLYGATVDGVTGKIMTARAPQDDRRRVLWLVGMAAPVCLVSGKLFRLLADLFFKDPRHAGETLTILLQFSYLTLPLLFLGLFFSVFLLGLGWEQFRYPGELVITAGRRTVEKIGRPQKIWSDRILEAMKRIGEQWKSSMIRRRERTW